MVELGFRAGSPYLKNPENKSIARI